jgi:hypothetical protein
MQRQAQKRASPGPALLSDIQARLGLSCAEGVHQEAHVCRVLSLRSWGAGDLPEGIAAWGTAPKSSWLLSAEFSLVDVTLDSEVSR